MIKQRDVFPDVAKAKALFEVAEIMSVFQRVGTTRIRSSFAAYSFNIRTSVRSRGGIIRHAQLPVWIGLCLNLLDATTQPLLLGVVYGHENRHQGLELPGAAQRTRLLDNLWCQAIIILPAIRHEVFSDAGWSCI